MLRQNIVFVENKAGSLKKVTALLAENKIDIFGFACFDAPEFAIFRMVCDAPEKAEALLSENGYMNRLTNVIAVDLKDEMRSLDHLLNAAAESNISLNYIYMSYHRKTQRPVVIVQADESYETECVLKNKGFHILKGIEDLNQ